MRMIPLLGSAAILASLSACKDQPANRSDIATPPSGMASNNGQPSLASAAPGTVPSPVPSAITPTTAPPVAGPVMAEHRFANWSGKWTGVEGMYVIITPTTPEHYRLEMQSDLDTRGSYEGYDSEHGISFKRNGKLLNLHRSNGKETGLKYLAGKSVCLTVKPGEGYCRD